MQKVDSQISKSNLAKLLATENINVEYRSVATASFDLGSRTLTVPLLNDMTPDMEDLFIGHEVGHALDTPIEYVSAQSDMPESFRTFLNVVEDARIERKIKDRYPGLKRSFNRGYREFMERDFFKVKDRKVNEMLLIDRINLHFKIGPFFSVEFKDDELPFLDKIERCESFDDVVSISRELFEFCEKELEQKREEMQMKMQSSGEDDDGEDGEAFDDYDNEPGEFDGEQEDGEAEEDGSLEEKEDNGSGSARVDDPTSGYDEVKSITDENLEQALRSLADDKEIRVGPLASTECVDYARLIVPYKTLLGQIFRSGTSTSSPHYKKTALAEFELQNKAAVSYLVKEFEMRKKAAELRRVVVSETGTLNTNKLHEYKFNDDIFRKIGNVAAGKNHGIVMFLDWSGSMYNNLKGTLEQLITMTTFCRKVGIPFEVYAFSTVYNRENNRKNNRNMIADKVGNLKMNESFHLLNFLSSRMKNSEYRMMVNDLLNFSENCISWTSKLHSKINPEMLLGGTPLNSTIFVASEIVNKFREKSKIEIVNVIFLTDGADSEKLWTRHSPADMYTSIGIGPSGKTIVSFIQDEVTKKKYRVGKYGVTPVLLQILKDRTGCNLIGFYIVENGRKSFDSTVNRFGVDYQESNYTTFRANKSFSITNYGYDEYFLIPGGNALDVKDDSLDDLLGAGETASLRKVKTAFLKMNRGRLTNRVLLSKVIEKIA